jgi:hypothetical protein
MSRLAETGRQRIEARLHQMRAAGLVTFDQLEWQTATLLVRTAGAHASIFLGSASLLLSGAEEGGGDAVEATVAHRVQHLAGRPAS